MVPVLSKESGDYMELNCYTTATTATQPPQPLTQPLAQPLAHFCLFRGQKWPQKLHSSIGYSLFGKLINFVSHEIFKLLVNSWSFLTLLAVAMMAMMEKSGL